MVSTLPHMASDAGRAKMRSKVVGLIGPRRVGPAVALMLGLLGLGSGMSASADPSVIHPHPLRVFATTPFGNGRAIAVDTQRGRLYWTLYAFDLVIHISTLTGQEIGTITPTDPLGGSITYGALAWDPTRQV